MSACSCNDSRLPFQTDQASVAIWWSIVFTQFGGLLCLPRLVVHFVFTPFGGYPVWWSIVFTPFGAVQHTEKVANAFDHNMADTKRVLIQQDLRYAKVEEDEDEEKTKTSM